MKNKMVVLLIASFLCGCRVSAPTVQNSSLDTFVQLVPGTTEKMFSTEHWIGKDKKADEIVMTRTEIDAFTSGNPNRITYDDSGDHCSLWDIQNEMDGEIVRAFITLANSSAPETTDGMYLDQKPLLSETLDALIENAALDAVPDQVKVRFGFSVTRSTLRGLTTNQFLAGSPDEISYDDATWSEFMPFQPLAVIHESQDKEWYYVLMDGFAGWIPQNFTALCCSREEWLERLNPQDFLVVTGREIRLSDDLGSKGLSGQLIPMGTKLPLISLADAPQEINSRRAYGCFIVKLPVRLDDGSIGDEFALIPLSDDVQVGYLPYTRANIVKQAFKLLGDRYGWGGQFHANDCSGIVKEIYACFGFRLPRTAQDQVNLPGLQYSSLEGLSDEEKIRILSETPMGSLLVFPGHIMIYLGMDEKQPFVISAVGSFATPDLPKGQAVSVNTVIVNGLDIHRRDGATWLSHLTGKQTLAIE